MATTKPETIDTSKFVTIGRNVKALMLDGILFLAINPANEGVRSASGKTMVVGTTNGNVPVPGLEAKGMKLGLNMYHA